MVPKDKKSTTIFVFLIVFLVGAFLIFHKEVSHDYFLKIKEKDSGEVLVKHEVEPQQEVSLWYIHSADGTPITQVFQVIDEGKLDLKKEKYEWYGAGLETGSELDYSIEDDQVVISGYDRAFESITIRVASTVPQIITVDEEEFDLSELAALGTSIEVVIKKKPNYSF